MRGRLVASIFGLLCLLFFVGQVSGEEAAGKTPVEHAESETGSLKGGLPESRGGVEGRGDEEAGGKAGNVPGRGEEGKARNRPRQYQFYDPRGWKTPGEMPQLHLALMMKGIQ
jgi:hypothetical protein